MKNTFLKINKPCSENWENMNPNELGNYCHLCSKTVIDFTQLSQSEISEKIKKEDICARVTQKQLNTPLLNIETHYNFNIPYSNITAGVLLATTMIAVGQPLQEKNQKTQTEIIQTNGNFVEMKNNSESKPNLPEPNDFTKINGTVNSEKENIPVKNVKITVVTVNKNFITYTLADGTFSLEVPTELVDNDNVIRATYNEITIESDPKRSFDFENTDYILTKAELNSTYKIVAKPQVYYLGGIGSYSEIERIPIVINNGQEIKYKDFTKAQQGKKSSCNLENKDYDYFEPEIAIAIYGKKAKYGLYIIKDKVKK